MIPKTPAGELINQGRAGTRKIARALRRRRYNRRTRLALAGALTLVESKEEVLVPADRSAESCSKLVLVKRFRAGREKVAGVERVIAKKVVQRAVILICS